MQLPRIAPGKRLTLPRPVGSADALLIATHAQRGGLTAVVTAEPADTQRLADELPLAVRATCLAAHALPPEYVGRADDYIAHICDEMLPALAAEGLVDAVDAFCEHLAFSPAQVERLFIKARELGLPVKLHAEQLSSLHGSSLAARYQALSADHLEFMTEDDAIAMAAAVWGAAIGPTNGQAELPPIHLFDIHSNFDRIHQMARASDGRVFVSDSYHHRIQVFSDAGILLEVIGSFGTAPGQFNIPTGIAFDLDGNVFVSEQAAGRIQKLSSSHAPLLVFGSPGSGPGGDARRTSS